MHIVLKAVLTSVLCLIVLSQTDAWQSDDDNTSYFGHMGSSIHDLLDLLRGVSVPDSNRCLSYYKSLADLSARFFECVANNSRPFHVCQNCLYHYAKFNQIHKLIENDTDLYATTLYKEGLTCMNIIEATDRVQVALTISNTVNQLWATSKCDDCFLSYNMVNDTINFTLKPLVEEFYRHQQKLEICIYNFTKKASSVDPLFQNYSANSTLCATCKEDYVNLTKHFEKMSNENDENNMCMDVVDLFNYTRIAWSKGYKCSYRDIDELNILIICGAFTLATVLFYIVSRLMGKEEKKQFVKIHRKKSYTSINSNYSSFNNNNIY